MARQFPDDPEIWYHVGERRMHAPVPFGGRPEAALEAFERSIALDPSFAPAYSHVLELTLLLGNPAQAAHYSRTYPAPGGTRDEAMSFRPASMVFDSGGVHAPAVHRALRAAGAGALDWTGNVDLRWLTDTAETSVVVLRELLTGVHDASEATPPQADSANWRQHLARALAFSRASHRSARRVRRAAHASRGLLFHRHLRPFRRPGPARRAPRLTG